MQIYTIAGILEEPCVPPRTLFLDSLCRHVWTPIGIFTSDDPHPLTSASVDKDPLSCWRCFWAHVSSVFISWVSHLGEILIHNLLRQRENLVFRERNRIDRLCRKKQTQVHEVPKTQSNFVSWHFPVADAKPLRYTIVYEFHKLPCVLITHFPLFN